MKKKTFKAILAAALAVIITVPCFSAFAANDTLVWDFYGYEYTYDYAGEVSIGTTAVPDDASDFIWYSFDVRNAGYYYIHFDYADMDAWVGMPESFDGNTAYDELEYIDYTPLDGHGMIYRLEEGKTIIGFDLYNHGENASFETEYLGAEITEIRPQYDLIYNYDIYEYEDKTYDFSAEFDVTFSDGKTITLFYLTGEEKSPIVTGENTFITKINGKEYEFTTNVYYTSDYIESVEVSNIEDYLYLKEYYGGFYYEGYPENETITVNFNDGSSHTFNINESDTITLPNGREVYYGFDVYETDIGNYYLDVYVGGECFASYKCEITDSDFEENMSFITDTVNNRFENSLFYLRRAFEIAFESGVIGFFENGAEYSYLYFSLATEAFASIFYEIGMFFGYMLS